MNKRIHFARILLFWLIAKPFVALVLGTRIHGIKKLPAKGPAILVANHNSHLDTLVLMTLFPTRLLPVLRPVAAADYFTRSRWLRAFALHIVRIIPITRTPSTSHPHPLTPCLDALDRGEILIVFPEGSRGEPEARGHFKNGIAHLAKSRPQVPVHPICLSGTGRALPKGEALFVPHVCRLAIGNPVPWTGDKADFMQDLEHRFDQLNRLIAPAPFPAHPNLESAPRQPETGRTTAKAKNLHNT